MIIIDATDLIMGRIGSFAANKAMLGETVHIINSELALISGDQKRILAGFVRMREMGTPTTGPIIHRMPHRLLKRSLRGMLPYKKTRGREAYKRILCHTGVPDELKDKKSITLKDANMSKLPNRKYIQLKTISKRLGAKIE